MHRAGNDAVQFKFRLRAHVDQPRTGRKLQKLMRFVRQQGACNRPGIRLAAAVGGVEQLGNAAHVGFLLLSVQYMKAMIGCNAHQYGALNKVVHCYGALAKMNSALSCYMGLMAQ